MLLRTGQGRVACGCGRKRGVGDDGRASGRGSWNKRAGLRGTGKAGGVQGGQGLPVRQEVSTRPAREAALTGAMLPSYWVSRRRRRGVPWGSTGHPLGRRVLQPPGSHCTGQSKDTQPELPPSTGLVGRGWQRERGRKEHHPCLGNCQSDGAGGGPSLCSGNPPAPSPMKKTGNIKMV